MKPFLPSLEVLEQRIAPAAISTYTNPEGGTVKITTSKGTDAELGATMTFINAGQGMTLDIMDLASHPVFRGTDLLFEVTGPGSADVSLLDAHGLDLGQVVVLGDVGKILAGDAALSTPGAKSLHVGSLGLYLAIPGPTTAYQSVIRGALPTLEIDHDLAGSLSIEGNAFSKITSAHIHGSLAGSLLDETGTLHVQGGIDTLLVDQDISGGEGMHAGSITAGGLIRSATITGNIAGCDGVGSGVLSTAGDILLLQIGGNVLGEDSTDSAGENGQVRARKITTATINGFIDGGYFDFSGSVSAALSIGTINVLGGLAGGHGLESGAVSAHTTITKAVIGASGGSGTMIVGGDGVLSGSVHAVTLNFVEVNGDVQGGAGKVSGGISSVGSTVKVLIHGKLTGGSMDNSGSIGSGGVIGEVEVQQGIFGGDGKLSGSVAAVGKITTATIGVGLNGGVGDFSGTVGSFGNLGTMHVAGSFRGGAGDHSGGILCGSTATAIVIDGSVKGGAGSNSGGFEGRFLPSVDVGADVQGGAGLQSGRISASGSVGTIDIAVSIIGYKVLSPVQPSDNSGEVFSAGPVTLIHVGGDIRAGIDPGSGSIQAFATITSVVVDGALIGGDDLLSGSIATVNALNKPLALRPSLTKVSIGGYIQGGDGDYSGVVQSAGSIGTLSVLGTTPAPGGAPFAAGDVVGGNGQYSGSIQSGGNMGTITIAGSLVGLGDGSAQVYSEVSIAKLTIGGSVKGQGYYGTDSTLVITPGQIVAKKILTSLEIGHDVFGGAGVSSAEINAGTIGSVLIHGSEFGGDGMFSGTIRAYGGDLTSL
jgi:hypothetical protein